MHVKHLLVEALGEPDVISVGPGDIFRWSLRRLYDLTMYVTLDAPEHPDVAHVMLSDGLRYQAKPVESHLVTKVEEAAALVDRIVNQWQRKAEKPAR